MESITKRILSPWWFLFWVLGLAGAGYLTEGRLGAIEGAVVAVVLAHAALLELLTEEREQNKEPNVDQIPN